MNWINMCNFPITYYFVYLCYKKDEVKFNAKKKNEVKLMTNTWLSEYLLSEESIERKKNKNPVMSAS
jgi:hypothetical protein